RHRKVHDREPRALSGNLARIIELQPWRDYTNIKVRAFSRLTESKFRVVALPLPPMRRCRWPRISWTRRAAKSSLRFRLGQLGEPALAESLSRKSLMWLVATPRACWK